MYDHRKLGRELELFDTDPLIGAEVLARIIERVAAHHAELWEEEAMAV